MPLRRDANPFASFRIPGFHHVTRRHRLANWQIPSLYAFFSLVAGVGLPRLENYWQLGAQSGMSASAAIAFYSAVGTGMIALTGVVFALAFVMVQFSAMAYSPRLSLWIARDRVLWHALGVFIATFLYSLAAIAWVDRFQSGRVPRFSAWTVLALLLASVAMFIALVERISLLQIHRMLAFTGSQGREVIEQMYPPFETPVTLAKPEEYRDLFVKQTLLHAGSPRSVQGIDEARLEALASEAGGVLEVVSAVGDTVVEGSVLLRVRAASEIIDQRNRQKSVVRFYEIHPS